MCNVLAKVKKAAAVESKSNYIKALKIPMLFCTRHTNAGYPGTTMRMFAKNHLW